MDCSNGIPPPSLTVPLPEGELLHGNKRDRPGALGKGGFGEILTRRGERSEI